MEEERVGSVVHVYPRVHAVAVKLDRGSLHPGDVVHFKGPHIDYLQRIERMEIDHARAREAHAGQVVSLQADFELTPHLHAEVMLVRSEFPGEEYG